MEDTSVPGTWRSGQGENGLRVAAIEAGGDLCGLLIGQAVREDWHAILGEPDETMTFTDSMAYDYGLPVGESDIYHFGEHELRLHADTDGVLRAVQLGK